jgi:nitroimidazol reductase NimA-like FMN-containing flavoprotein (pyridoxamine 5'-phosphate oxidase superfamily)
VHRHLEASEIPLRLACATRSGQPLVLSLWYLWRDGALWCATQAQAALVGHLRRDPRCGFEVASERPPYCGVRGTGRAAIDPSRGEEVLRALLRRYQGGEDGPLARWLLSRAASEVAIRIDPGRIGSWDYRERMRAG